MEDKFVIKITTLILIGMLFVLTFLILKPILIAIIFGLIFAYMFRPLYKKIKEKLKSPNLSASIVMLLIAIAIIIPLWFLVPMIFEQTIESFLNLQGFDFSEALKNVLPNLANSETTTSLTIHFNNIMAKFISSFLNQFTDFFINLPDFLLKFVIFLFVFFYAVRDAEKLREFSSTLSPFSKQTEKRLLSEFRNVTNAIIYGQILVGIVQGLALGLALFAFGVPHALLLTIITLFVSILPILGPFLIWAPVAAYLLIVGNVFSGIFILIYGAFFVSTIDNFLRPMILARKSNLSVVLGVIGTIGGLYYFGIIGLVLGPLILAYILILFEFYKEGKLYELFSK